MAKKTVAELAFADAMTPEDLIVVVQKNNCKKMPVKDLAKSVSDSVQGFVTQAQAAATDAKKSADSASAAKTAAQEASKTADSAAETAHTAAASAKEYADAAAGAAEKAISALENRLKSGAIADAELHLGFYLDENGDLCQKEG